MNEYPQLASALLTVFFSALMLVIGQLYIESSSKTPNRVIPIVLTVPAR
jgi:hypothetical protein